MIIRSGLCIAVCQQKCLNGGVCKRPNVCSCPNAFEGPACELDVDECATGAHGCLGPSSRCVNMAGWYYCACSPGYQNVIMHPISSAGITATTMATDDLNMMETTWSPLLGTTCQGKLRANTCSTTKIRKPNLVFSILSYMNALNTVFKTWYITRGFQRNIWTRRL